jgi:hypothetical protein
LKKLDGVQIHVVHPNEVKWITESRGKNDRVDAKKLAELARAGLLPWAVHVVEGPVRELWELVSARQQLQRTRIALINTIRGSMYQEGHRYDDPHHRPRLSPTTIRARYCKGKEQEGVGSGGPLPLALLSFSRRDMSTYHQVSSSSMEEKTHKRVARLVHSSLLSSSL